MRIHAVSCGYGGVGPSLPPPAEQPQWVLLTLDAEADQAAQLVAESITLVDDSGAAVAVAMPGARVHAGASTTWDSDPNSWPHVLAVSPGTGMRFRVHAQLASPLECRGAGGGIAPGPDRTTTSVGPINDGATWLGIGSYGECATITVTMRPS